MFFFPSSQLTAVPPTPPQKRNFSPVTRFSSSLSRSLLLATEPSRHLLMLSLRAAYGTGPVARRKEARNEAWRVARGGRGGGPAPLKEKKGDSRLAPPLACALFAVLSRSEELQHGFSARSCEQQLGFSSPFARSSRGGRFVSTSQPLSFRKRRGPKRDRVPPNRETRVFESPLYRPKGKKQLLLGSGAPRSPLPLSFFPLSHALSLSLSVSLLLPSPPLSATNHVVSTIRSKPKICPTNKTNTCEAARPAPTAPARARSSPRARPTPATATLRPCPSRPPATTPATRRAASAAARIYRASRARPRRGPSPRALSGGRRRSCICTGTTSRTRRT